MINERKWLNTIDKILNKINFDNSKDSLYLINGLFSDSIELYRYKRLIEINGNLETKIECIGSVNNQSCLIKNLYFHQKTFWILTRKTISYPLLNIRIGAWIPYKLIINRRRFYSSIDLEEFVKNEINPIVVSNTTVYFDQPWLTNIGHALFDGLYPAYVALIRFSPRHLHPFRILLSGSDHIGHSDFSQDVYRRFSGLGIINITILEDISEKQWFAFEEIIIGTGDLCQRCLQPNLQLPGGIELNASRYFRDRMYKQFGLNNSLTQINHQQRIINAYIIDNKRYTNKDKQEINFAIDEINQYTDFLQIQYKNNQLKSKWPLIHVSYIRYPHIAIRNDGSLQLNATEIESTSMNSSRKMFAQLLLLKTTDIHISGPGTGQMYQTFLHDGSININLGGIAFLYQNDTTKNYTSFMEQYLTSGTPYIKGFYYPINQRTKGIQKDILIQLIRQAAQLIIDGFSIPVNPNDNLAPDGQLFVEMCQLDKEFCQIVTQRWQDDYFQCIDTWPEDIIHEKGPWSPQGILIDNSTHIICKLNRTLINQLRIKYNIDYSSFIQ